jgi:predicted phage-related endonuclease/flagellum-specific peptidoglycan hydrolase FlgJ
MEEMIQHELIQGSPEWHAFRLEHDGASEAAIMLGISDLARRTELLDAKATGVGKQFSDWVQEHILDHGHEVEALARPIIEEQYGIRLYPEVYSRGRMSASCDGLTMAGTIGWEHKQWNRALAAAVLTGELPEKYMAQPQQCMLVTGAKKWIFTVSDGSEKNMVSMAILPDPAWFERISAGWDQFQKDLDGHTPCVIVERPTAQVSIELPALYIQAQGAITDSNMTAFGLALQEKLSEVRAIALVTDQDFANAKAAASMFRDTIKKLALTKDAMLEQTLSIGEAARMIDAWREDLRLTALKLEKDVIDQDLIKKRAMVADASEAYRNHLDTLYAETKPIELNVPQPDFASALKNKRNYASMHDAINTLLANSIIAADAVAKDIRAKLLWCPVTSYGFLLHDLQQIISKPMEDFQLLVMTRIENHKKAEAEKLEVERQRIRAEEEARANAEIERAKLEAEAKREHERQAEMAKAVLLQRQPVCFVDGEPAYVGDVFYDWTGDKYTIELLSNGIDCKFGSGSTSMSIGCADILSRSKEAAISKAKLKESESEKREQDRKEEEQAKAPIVEAAATVTTQAASGKAFIEEVENMVFGDAEKRHVPPSSESLRVAVVDAQDEITEFLNMRNMSESMRNTARAILVEFIKWKSARELRNAA